MTNKLDDVSRSLTASLSGGLHSNRKLFAHGGTMGSNSEERWIDWLRGHLPRRYGVEQAVIIDKNGREAEQIDVVIFDPQYTPILYAEEKTRVLPAESVYAVFESKQKLDAPYIAAASQKAASVRALHRTSAPIYHAGGVISQPKAPFPILAGILALESDWTPPLGDPLHKALAAAPPGGALDFGFAARDGYFLRDPPAPNAATTTWTTHAGEHLALHFLLHLLDRLAKLGTAPAIDFAEYVKGLTP